MRCAVVLDQSGIDEERKRAAPNCAHSLPCVPFAHAPLLSYAHRLTWLLALEAIRPLRRRELQRRAQMHRMQSQRVRPQRVLQRHAAERLGRASWRRCLRPIAASYLSESAALVVIAVPRSPMLVGDEGNGSIMAAARSSASVRGCRRAVCGTRCRISRRHGQRRLASAAVGRACCAWQWPWSSRRGHSHPISSSSSATLGSAAAAAAAASDDRSADDGEMGARRRLSHGVREHCAGFARRRMVRHWAVCAAIRVTTGRRWTLCLVFSMYAMRGHVGMQQAPLDGRWRAPVHRIVAHPQHGVHG